MLKKILNIYRYYKLKRNNKINLSSNIKNSVFEGNCEVQNNSFIANSYLGNYVKIKNNVKINKCSINDYTYVSNDTEIVNATIGKFCSIGPHCKIGLGIHPTKDFVSAHPSFYSKKSNLPAVFSHKNYINETKKIMIGNDVWIGCGVIILDGLMIGDGAFLGAGAVITKDVEPYSIMGGVPAKLIKKRFSDDDIDFLRQVKWWDKDNDFFKLNYIKFHSIEDFKNFIKKNER